MVAKSGFGGTDNLPHTLGLTNFGDKLHNSDKFHLVSKIWSNHKFVSWHDVWTLFGVVHFVYMCSTRSISYLSLLCAPLVVNPLLKLLKLDQTCLNAIFHFIWSPWAFASTCMCCYIYMTTSTRASFQSTCYNFEASAFVHFYIHNMIWGELHSSS
jgi:hypothetical protein